MGPHGAASSSLPGPEPRELIIGTWPMLRFRVAPQLQGTLAKVPRGLRREEVKEGSSLAIAAQVTVSSRATWPVWRGCDPEARGSSVLSCCHGNDAALFHHVDFSPPRLKVQLHTPCHRPSGQLEAIPQPGEKYLDWGHLTLTRQWATEIAVTLKIVIFWLCVCFKSLPFTDM